MTAAAVSVKERLIVALDCPTLENSLDLIERLGDEVVFYKVGWRLFLQGGLSLVDTIRGQGKRVFLDLKMDDISETVDTAVREIAGRAHFLTLQGGSATARAALAGRGAQEYPKLLQVTLLSSLDQDDLGDICGPGAPTMNEYVLHRAGMSIEAGCDGLIAAGSTVRRIREQFGPKPILVTPGIRPAGSSRDDQKRAITPAEALRDGSDYLVVGRPIHAAPDPVAAARAIIDEMSLANAG
jgi:orotidine-5'-phosphate decarboxylase